jgi:hypothetical protein
VELLDLGRTCHRGCSDPRGNPPRQLVETISPLQQRHSQRLDLRSKPRQGHSEHRHYIAWQFALEIGADATIDFDPLDVLVPEIAPEAA